MTTVRADHGSLDHPTTRHRLFFRTWQPPTVRAAILVIHGFGEHSARYEAFASALVEQGCAVVCPDLPGHGYSSGTRGNVDGFSNVLSDLEILAGRVIPTVAPSGRYAVFGHSLGGLVAIHWALRHPAAVTSFILQSPFLGVGFPVPAWKTRLAHVAGHIAPWLCLPAGVNPAWLSHDPEVAQRYRDDRLVVRQMSVRLYRELQMAMTMAIRQAADIRTPTLLLYGAADQVVDVSLCRAVGEALQCEKRVRVFPGCYHELHHEAVRPQIVEETVAWVLAHP